MPTDLYPWLPPEEVMAWLKVDPENAAKAALVERCRKSTADWIQDQRKDRFTTEGDPPVTTFTATDRIVMAGILGTARVFARVDSPNGVVAFEELGAGSILAKDPDVARYLGRSKWAVG